MKKLILAASLALSLPLITFANDHDHDHGGDNSILAKSRVSLATVTALEQFESSQPGALWAFKTAKIDDEASAQILYVSGNQTTRSVDYDCHFHAHGNAEEAHCHDGADVASSLTAPTTLPFEVDGFIAALSGALDTFERKIAPLTSLAEIKMWQAQGEMSLTLTHDIGAGSVKSHFMCHVHAGAHIDCHRSRNPGPQEPNL